MTAIIGVMNKHAVAIAADSAVTLGGGRKVLNSANKLFSLSKHHPVAIAIYGNADLVGTPWEIIIKEYRKNLKEKSFSNLKGYVDDFFAFIKGQQYYCSDSDYALNYLKGCIRGFCAILANLNMDKNDLTRTFVNICNRNTDYLPGYSNNTIEFLKENISDELDLVVKNLTIDGEEAKALLINLLVKGTIPEFFSGLVFVGYGKDEIYPSMYPCEVGCIINGTLAIKEEPAKQISNSTQASIMPFAQTDVMQTILDGISPQIVSIYCNCLEQTLGMFTNQLADAIKTNDPTLANQIRNISTSPFVQKFLKLSRDAQFNQYTKPFVDSVVNLEKEDLSDFAESLITLTSMKRKISPNQETVGGPVDVMVISKGDGIIWMKRKHYFDAEKNHHFFSNYFEN